MLSSMIGPAVAGTITPITVTVGDDGIPPDSSLQSETYISTEANATFETTKPEKADFVVEEGKEVDLATPVSVESESKMEVQMTKSVAEMVTPVHKVNRSVEVNVKRPSWMSEDWKFVRIFRTNGASAGTVDIYYYVPVSGKKFRSMPEVLRFLKTGTMRKRSTGGDATSICWVLTDSSADTWAPFVHGNMVPEGQRQEWDAVFSTVSQRNANRDAVVDGFLLWRRNRQKVLHLNSVHDVQVRAMDGVTKMFFYVIFALFDLLLTYSSGIEG
ncbi:hypothetical protein CQW23_32086 [Capsicum baccatum]|uniref:MBD domain-containing protein n=1 Tax=Capsicum baccatum TaxID=33114 RepID=A0A2G2V5R0_CAPBA|nr:hypothetical protein CQW23_32086 [Capsicum baccatum]